MIYPSNEYEIDFDEIAERITIEEFAQEIGAERADNSSWHCPLPWRHNNRDRDPSLSIYRVSGRVHATCYGCNLSGTPVHVLSEVDGCEEVEAARRLARAIGLSPDDEPSLAASASASTQEEEVYTYTDHEGDPLFQVVRFPEKRFRVRRPDSSGGWIWNLEGVDRVLYRLPQVLAAVESDETVYIVEGEKDVRAIEDHGGTATCNPLGAGKWRSEFAEALEDACVVVVGDRDDVGIEHAREVADQLEGVASSVRLVLPAEGNDAYDHLQAGYGLDDFLPMDSHLPDGAGESAEAGVVVPEVCTRGDVSRFGNLRTMAEVEPEEVEWLWEPYIPYGTLTVLTGDPGVGKSTLSLAVAAAATTGAGLPGDPRTGSEPQHVLAASAEDVAEKTIVPRLDANGANREQVIELDEIVHSDGTTESFTLASEHHNDFLRKAISWWGVKLVIIDPLHAYVGGTDTHRNERMRDLLRPVAQIAEDTGVAILLIRHARKSETSNPLYWGVGSIGITGAARSELGVGTLSEESEQRVLVQYKNNLARRGPSRGFRIEDDRIVWTGVSDATARDIMSSSDGSPIRPRDRAKEFLRNALADGPRHAEELKEEAESRRIKLRTLRRAREDLGVESFKEKFQGRSLWRFREHDGTRAYAEVDNSGDETSKRPSNEGENEVSATSDHGGQDLQTNTSNSRENGQDYLRPSETRVVSDSDAQSCPDESAPVGKRLCHGCGALTSTDSPRCDQCRPASGEAQGEDEI